MFSFKLLCLTLFVLLVFVASKPLEESKSVASKVDDGEMMEGAESQNPFLPRFAMRKLRERSEKANAQRRNYQGRRMNPPKRYPCPDRYY